MLDLGLFRHFTPVPLLLVLMVLEIVTYNGVSQNRRAIVLDLRNITIKTYIGDTYCTLSFTRFILFVKLSFSPINFTLTLYASDRGRKCEMYEEHATHFV